MRPQSQQSSQEEDEASVARTTEVALGRVKWNLTDEDGQLNLAQFEMKDFLYEKVLYHTHKILIVALFLAKQLCLVNV